MEVSLVHSDLSLPSGLGQSHLQLAHAGPSPAEAVSVPQGRATLCHVFCCSLHLILLSCKWLLLDRVLCLDELNITQAQ